MKKPVGVAATILLILAVSIAVAQAQRGPHFVRHTLSGGESVVEITRAGATSALPPGTTMPYAGGVVPEGWLLCDGSLVTINSASRPLLTAIQTQFGGDGQKNFRLPDLRGRTLIGLDNMGGTPAHRIHAAWASRLGKDGYGGQDEIALSLEQMPSHSHHANTGADGGKHSHLIAYKCEIGHGGPERGAEYTRASQNASVKLYSDFETGNSGGGHVHDFTTDPAGNGKAFSLIQPTAAVNYLIKY